MVRLFLLGFKGYQLLKGIDSRYFPHIELVVIAKDAAMDNDYFAEIQRFCEDHHMQFVERGQQTAQDAGYAVLVGWRWLITPAPGVQLIVFHDSLLPRCRGFNPLVTALINGDRRIGATCLYGSAEYDKGDIINQLSTAIEYPISIQCAMDKIAALYVQLFEDLADRIAANNIQALPQNDAEATYSLWRDEEDYFINWNWSSEKIERFINAVGYPYAGARCFIGDEIILIKSSKSLPEDVVIENRQAGKVIFKKDGTTVIVCGEGLLGIQECYFSNGEKYPMQNKFRIRFS